MNYFFPVFFKVLKTRVVTQIPVTQSMVMMGQMQKWERFPKEAGSSRAFLSRLRSIVNSPSEIEPEIAGSMMWFSDQLKTPSSGFPCCMVCMATFLGPFSQPIASCMSSKTDFQKSCFQIILTHNSSFFFSVLGPKNPFSIKFCCHFLSGKQFHIFFYF